MGDNKLSHIKQRPLSSLNNTSQLETSLVNCKISPAKPTEVYETFWRFAAERQRIFFARLENYPYPWTDDPILSTYKFTNAYRASDRVSQYLIKHVIYEGEQAPEEIFFRIILFKLFNKIETWELLKRHVEKIHTSNFTAKRFSKILSRSMNQGFRIYSAAYIMPSGGASSSFNRKHEMHLSLLHRMLQEQLPDKLVEARSMNEAFYLLREYPTIGDFLAYQFVTDINYSTLTNFSEMEFVMPGPGARDGIRKCFSDLGGLTESEIIRAVTENQAVEFERLGLEFRTLWGRPLHLIDCQNLFCEVDKYARIKHPQYRGYTARIKIKQKYCLNPAPVAYWYPPKWNINRKIGRSNSNRDS